MHSWQTTLLFSGPAPVFVTHKETAAPGQHHRMCQGHWLHGLAQAALLHPQPPRVSPGLGKGDRGAEGENSTDLACRPGMESAQQRLSRATWMHFVSGRHRQGGDGIWDVWFAIGWKTQPRPCRRISLTVVSNSCNVWSGVEAAENEVTYRNMPKTWMLGNNTTCVLFSWIFIYER